jgi:hypothetical protein
MSATETHEPDEPINWPEGHVLVERETRNAEPLDRLKLAEVGVSITDMDADECILVALADHKHFLHSTTAKALSDQLLSHDGHAVAITIHGVTHTVGQNASRGLRQTLERRLTEWNKYARSNGALGV